MKRRKPLNHSLGKYALHINGNNCKKDNCLLYITAVITSFCFLGYLEHFIRTINFISLLLGGKILQEIWEHYHLICINDLL